MDYPGSGLTDAGSFSVIRIGPVPIVTKSVVGDIGGPLKNVPRLAIECHIIHFKGDPP